MLWFRGVPCSRIGNEYGGEAERAIRSVRRRSSCASRLAAGPGASNVMAVTYRYPVASLVPDGLRALAGLAFTGIPLVRLPVASWFGMVLGAGVVLFGVFGVMTVLRARTQVRVGDEGIETIPAFRGRVRWDRLRSVKLRYFAVRRERERKRGQGARRGWMQLVLKGEGGVVRIDSRLDGFDDVLRRVAAAAAAAAVRLDPVTRANFEAAGLAVAPDSAEEPSVGGARTGRDGDA